MVDFCSDGNTLLGKVISILIGKAVINVFQLLDGFHIDGKNQVPSIVYGVQPSNRWGLLAVLDYFLFLARINFLEPQKYPAKQVTQFGNVNDGIKSTDNTPFDQLARSEE